MYEHRKHRAYVVTFPARPITWGIVQHKKRNVDIYTEYSRTYDAFHTGEVSLRTNDA